MTLCYYQAMTELHRDLAIQGGIALWSELEGLRREKIPIDKFEEKVRKHLIVDLRKQGNVKPQIKP
mgnify:CR=1 FL=1